MIFIMRSHKFVALTYTTNLLTWNEGKFCVVYVIKCCTCNKIYIGETGRRLGDRFREHLRSTRQTNNDLPVGRHFASPRHACTDKLVSVIRSGFRDTQDRRRFEARMIFKHKTLHPGGLNTDFTFLETLKIYAR